MNLLFLSMPGGAEWLVINLFIFVAIPFIAYRIGYNFGKKAGKQETDHKNDPTQA